MLVTRSVSEGERPFALAHASGYKGCATPTLGKPKIQNPKSKLVFALVGVSALVLAGAMLGFGPQRSDSSGPPARAVPYVAEIVKEYPHDEAAWTQGLVIADGDFFESTGMEGKSTLRRFELETGKVLQTVPVDARLFGEGLTALGDRLYFVTWKTGEGFVYDRKTLKVVKTFRYSGEGWGLTTDGKQLILSDGTDNLRFIDPSTLRVTRRIKATLQGRPVQKLNELEYVDGEIWANVWYESYIIRLDPKTGRSTGWIDLTDVIQKSGRTDDDAVANGIAWDEKNQRLFVTGKHWPKLFEIRVREK